MTAMPRSTVFASLILALGFAWVTYVLMVWEPQNGFAEIADYFDPDKLRPANQSFMWLSVDRLYLCMAVAILLMAVRLRDQSGRPLALIVATGSIASAMQALIGMIGIVTAALPGLIAEPGVVDATTLGLVATRFAVLFTLTFALGGWIICMSWHNLSILWFPRVLSYCGMLAGVVCMLFWLMPLPVPALLALWFAAVGLHASWVSFSRAP